MQVNEIESRRTPLATTALYVRSAPQHSPLAWAERIAAAAGLAATALPMLAVLASVRALSRQAPLVAHRRVGQNGEPFWMLKVRTMWDRRKTPSVRTTNWIEYLPDAGLPVLKRGPDPRVTSAFAAFCRRFSIDEFPQLLHVVSGKMRLVGPRPLTQAELDVYYEGDAAEVLSVPPGITGLWQVLGRNQLTYPQRRRLDRFFVRKLTWRLYWFVLARTPRCVLGGRDAW